MSRCDFFCCATAASCRSCCRWAGFLFLATTKNTSRSIIILIKITSRRAFRRKKRRESKSRVADTKLRKRERVKRKRDKGDDGSWASLELLATSSVRQISTKLTKQALSIIASKSQGTVRVKSAFWNVLFRYRAHCAYLQKHVLVIFPVFAITWHIYLKLVLSRVRCWKTFRRNMPIIISLVVQELRTKKKAWLICS